MSKKIVSKQTEELSTEELYPKLFSLLDEINHNIKLLRKTRREVRKKYPRLFSS